MKRASCFLILSTLVLSGSLSSQSYTCGDTLSVVAHSGLRLRTSPNHQSGTIRILSFGESVVVENTFGFDGSHQDKSGWLTGQWIAVMADGIHGYVLDSYLSALAMPSHENQLCDESSTGFSIPLQQYIEHHYPMISDEQGPETREDIDQCITWHINDIQMTRTSGRGWYKTDIIFSDARLAEVVNLLSSMLIGDDMRDMFEASLKFYKNKTCQINRVIVELDSPVQIEQHPDGTIELSITELTAG